MIKKIASSPEFVSEDRFRQIAKLVQARDFCILQIKQLHVPNA